MPAFIGLDLAWTAYRHPVPFASGLCVLEGTSAAADLRCTHLSAEKHGIQALCEQISAVANAHDTTVVAIDAPLVVTPRRTAERALNRAFAPFKAGAYLASVDWLARKDLRAGPLLADALRRRPLLRLRPAGAQVGSEPQDRARSLPPRRPRAPLRSGGAPPLQVGAR